MSRQSKDALTVEVAGLSRDLPLFEVAPGVRIAIVNILGDTELIRAAARELADKIQRDSFDVLATAEAKSIPLIFALALEVHRPWIVFRKSYKPYMGKAFQSETLSITTGKPQTLFLDEKDIVTLSGKRVALVDDVISTGSTLQGMELLVSKAGAQVSVRAAIFTEGDRAKWHDIVALGHLPVLTGE